MARDRIELPTRGFSVLLLYRDYVTLSLAICIYSSVQRRCAERDFTLLRRRPRV